MEDGGSEGSVASHWEVSFVGEELMQGFKGPNMFLTTMTAKLFDDMGYYIGNLFI